MRSTSHGDDQSLNPTPERLRKFKGGLGEYLIVTSADRDATLQSSARQHFKKKPAPFAVQIVFWADIVADVSSDEALVAKHWTGFAAKKVVSDNEILTQMAQVFDRPAFTTPFSGESHLLHFKQAITDTIMTLNTGARRTREHMSLPAIPSRHDLKDARTRQTFADIESALVALRGVFDDFVHRGEIRRCPCGQPDCSMLMSSQAAADEMNRRRDAVLDLFRVVHAQFGSRVSW